MNNAKLFIITTLFVIGAMVLETTVFNFPFVFLIVSILLLFVKKNIFFVGALFVGFMIDALRVSNFGLTPLFIFGTVILVLLYERLSGSKDLVVASIVIGAVTLVYTYVLSYSIPMLITFFIFVIAGALVFDFLRRRGKIFI